VQFQRQVERFGNGLIGDVVVSKPHDINQCQDSNDYPLNCVMV
jgi:hypothetical protein